MQRVGLERLARGFAGDAVEQAGAEEIDHDRDDDHGEGRERRLHHMTLVAEQPLGRLPDHHPRQQEQQSCFGQRRHAFNLAVAVVMLLVGGLAGDAHRKIGHHRGAEIDQRMRGLGQNGERAGECADHAFRQRQTAGRGDRGERDPFFLVLHRSLGALEWRARDCLEQADNAPWLQRKASCSRMAAHLSCNRQSELFARALFKARLRREVWQWVGRDRAVLCLCLRCWD